MSWAICRETHGNARRTEIVEAANEIGIEDLIADEDVAISITHSGLREAEPP